MERIFLLLAVMFAGIVFTKAQSPVSVAEKMKIERVSVVFGLIQPIALKGFNFEVNYWAKKLVFDYSHGFGLNVEGETTGSDYNNQRIDFKVSHSTGIGIGYRLSSAFNLRFEPKMHIYETYYDKQDQVKRNSIVNFTTYTIGLGLYYRWLPFANKDNPAKGITVAPSIRYWYKIGSTLDNDQFFYFNSRTNRNEILNAPNIGIADTPFLFNVSVGYTF